ncbi:MAG: hypothetical protein ACXWF4_04690, partial [Candidatus Aminicenantales bacterium]
MSMTRIKTAGAILLLLGLAAACDEPRYRMTDTKTVALEGATRAEVGMHMGAGELRVRAAEQAALLEA